MFTFNNFKRVIALLFVLFGAVCAVAQTSTNVFTVNTTVSTTTGSTGNTGSLMDAVKKINSEGGAWKIVFKEGLDTILIDGEQTISDADELVFAGNEETVLKWNGDLTLDNVKKISLDKMRFFSDEGGVLQFDSDIDIDYITNSVFEGVSINAGTNFPKIQVNIAKIKNCIFTNDKQKAILNGNVKEGSKINIIEDCSFNVTSNDINKSIFEGRWYIEIMSDCNFHQSYGHTIAGFYGTIRNCNFVSENSQNNDASQTICLYFVTCDELINCSMEGYGGNLWKCKVGIIDSNTFQDGTIDEIECKSILNSKFNGEARISHSNSIDIIKNCVFICNGQTRAISATTGKIKEISYCRFSTPSVGYSSISLDTEGIDIHDNTFEINNNSASAIENKNEKGISGKYSRNIIINKTSSIYVHCIRNSSEQTPEFFSILYNSGVIELKGSSGPNADVEIFQNNGDGVSAIKYLTTVQSDADGNFEANIDASSLDNTGNFCFIATATYEESRTSVLSKSICYEFPKNIYVKKTGTGDGSNWENAMSEKDFYTLLPKAKDGTTFHIAAGTYQKGSKLSAYKINSDVNLIGGYPADAEDGAVSDPVNNHTTFDTEKGPYGYTAITTELFSLSEGVSVEFHNLDFTHSSIMGNGAISKLLVDSCRFMSCCNDIKLSGYASGSLIVRNSYFGKMIEGLRLGSGVYHISLAGGYALVENSTFVGSTADRGLKAISLSGLKKNSHVQNCTFINLMGPNTGYQIEFHATEGDGPIYFINNTIVGNGENEGINTDQHILSFLNGVAFIGNIYAGTDNVNVKEPNTIANGYNLVGFESASKTNKTITIDDVASILAGTYTDGVFSPTLSSKNGGFTPTVELISDKLPDGAPIRFPLEETSVTTDQRGVARIENTCPGAYEIEDDAPPMEVYVKKTGTGHGTSWDDAMGEADFFSAMPKAKEGTTFYVAAGEYTSDVVVEINSSVKVIGGYPTDAQKGALTCVKDNKTIFKSKKYDCFRTTDKSKNSDIEFSGIVFEKSNINTIGADNLDKPVNKIIIDSCIFSGDQGFIEYNANEIYIYNSYYYRNESPNMIGLNGKSLVKIESSTFEGGGFTYSPPAINVFAKDVQIVNSTFVLTSGVNRLVLGINDNEKCSIYNNTFICNISASSIGGQNKFIYAKNTDFRGNIFVSNGSNWTTESTNIFEDNISTSGLQESALCKEVSKKEWTKILDTQYDEETNLFTPNLTVKEGGFAPTVAVLSDKLQDGNYIRFTRLSDVKRDANNVVRLDNTCPGAYEIECSADTVSATDTIRIGEEIAGRTFASIGVYDSIFEKLENRLGCDSVVMHKVIVTPNPDRTEYYVKKTGKGDGSSWDDAMGEKEFDLVLKTLATDNVTFYVAEGTYHAAYDKNLNEVKRAGSWTTSHPISIIGGFPASSTGKVKSTDVPDVKEYPTILSGDYKDNTEAQGHECYFDFQNSSDDFQGDLFTIDMSETGGESKISNIILTGVRNQHGAPSTIVIKGSKTKESSFTFYQSEVRRSEQAIETEDVTNLTVDECEFNHVLGSINTTASSKITRSTFNYSGINIHDAEECEVSNCTFAHTSLDVVCGAQTNRLYNNTFVSCGSTNIYLDRTNYIRGNIFASSSIYSSGENTGKTVIEDNVIACAYGDLSLEDKNIITNRATLSDGILDMEYSAEDDKISPNLTNKGGRTSVVALLKEVLPTGEKLRFDRLDGIATDQRGVERNAKTCVGAYEIDCSDFKVTFSPENVLCNELGGTLTLAATGGTGNYTALVKTADGDTLAYKSFSKDKELTVNGLKLETTYTAVVEDAQGCHAEDKGIRVWRKDLPEVKAEARAYMQTCHGEDNGEILIKYSGNDEEENLLFSAVGEDGKSHNVSFSSAEGRAVIDSLAPGDYSVFMDFNVEDCDLPSPAAMQVGNVTVDSIGEMGIDSLTLKVTYATCTNPANGRADIDILNWLNGYTITVYSNGNPIWGTMEASPNGEYEGAAPCQFYFENDEKKAKRTAHLKIPRINGGKFTIEVKDECENVCKPFTFEVGKLYKPFVQLREDNSHIELDCAGMSNGSIYFSVNGYAPKSKAYVNDEEVFVGHGTCMKDNLPAGKYVIAYRSIEEGCKDEAVDTIVITEPLPLEIHNSAAPVVCEDLGTIAYSGVAGGTPDYTYQWTDAAGNLLGTDDSLKNLSVGKDYKLVVTDSKSCKDSVTFDVELLNTSGLNNIVIEKVDHKDQYCYNEDNGKISIQFSGNAFKDPLKVMAINDTGIVKSVVTSDESGLIELKGLPADTYDVKLSYDFGDCDVSVGAISVAENLIIQPLEKPEFIEDNYFKVDNKCENGGKGRMHLEMKGWKEDVYSWTIERAAQPSDTVYKHCGDKLSNGATAFDLWTLPEGVNIFTMWDACTFKYTKTETIKADYTAPLTLDTFDCKAYTCADRTDGSFTFTAWPWDVEDSVTILKDGKKWKEDLKPTEIKEGKAYFKFKNQGAGTYTLSATDLCKNSADSVFNFTKFSEKNGLLTVEAGFDDNPEECELGKRIIKATANGGTAPYVYSISRDGKAVETSEAIDTTVYDSKLLGEGKYSVSVTDNTDCKVVYGEDLTIKSESLNIKLGTLKKIDQYCYGVDNAGVSVAYSGFDKDVAKLRLSAKDKSKKDTIYESFAEDEKDTLKITGLPVGSYDVKVQLLGFNGCELNGGILLETEVEFQPLEKPEFIEDNYFKVDNKCKDGGKGRMHLEMKGWKEDVYSWTIERAAQPSDTVYKHCGDKLSNGATAFDLWTLPEGVNIFTMWDACTFKYTKTETIKADYTSPLTLDTFDCKAYTCADRTDGSFTFTAWPWDVEDSVTILKDGKTWKEDLKPTEIKEGKAYFKFENQGAGTYTLSATDLCKRAADTVFNFTKFSEQNGLLTVEAGFDDNPEECELGKRIIKATANGGTAPYVYSISRDGKAVETSEATDTTVYDSKLLGEGKYSVSVTDNTDCKVVYGEDLTIKSESLNIKLGTLKKIDQYCYGVDNAGVSVAYSGFDKDVAKLRLSAKDKSKKDTIYESFAEDEKDTLKITGLPVGSYDVKVQLLGFNGCELNGGILLETEVEFQPLEMPEFIEDNYFKVDNKCENGGKGRMHLEMKGWKEDVYSWTIERAAQPSDTVYKHCGDKLANGATAFDLWTLPEGVNIFTMWDACTFKYSKTETIKGDYTAPLTLDTFDCKAYTCADRTDGSFTFTAWPWDVEDSVTILKDGKKWKEDLKPTEIKEGKAYFKFKNQGAGTYTLSATDLCNNSADSVFNFTKFSEKNGLLTVDVDFDAESAKCDANKRIFKIKATGGTAPYVYNITKDGEEFLTTEATESGLYTTQLLPVGNYKVSVSDETACKAEHGDDLTINSTHTLKADMREVVCGDSKNVIITTSIDGGETTAIGFTAVDEEGKQYDASAIVDDKGTVLFTLPADTVLKGLIAETEDQCRTYAEVGTLPLDENALAKAKVEIDTVINERCYHANNGEIRLSYTGQESPYGIAMRLINVNDITDTINTESQYGKELKFKVDTLAPGEYEIYMVQKVGSCDAGTEPKKIQNIKIDSIPHPFELVWDTVIQSKCASDMNGRLALRVHGWSRYNCTWELSKSNGTKFIPFASDTTAFPVSGDTATWGSDNRDAGLYRITWTDYCGNSVSKQVQIDTIKKPTIELLASSHTDLMCGYEKAYIDFKYESPSAENKRILIKYKPTPDSEDWDYTTEPLKPSNTYRLYGFNPGSGNRGHKKAEGTDYELTDADKGLPGGQYLIFYMDPTEKCADDDTFISVNVYKPEVKLNLAKQDVLCYSENNGVINIVPTRSGKNPIYYDYMDQYPDCTDYSEIRDKGRNFGSIVFKDSASQVKALADRDKFLSDVFSDVAYLSITAKSMSQKDLYKLMQDSIKAHGSNLKYPLSKFYRGGGSDYAVSDWIGFNTMPVDMYYVTLTDTFGCVYTDSIEVKGPEDGLRVISAVYPNGSDPECNAESRRIKFTCTGGYYPYFYSVVNTDEDPVDENDTKGSGMIGQDYVTGAIVEKYKVNNKIRIDYTSKMLKAGTYEVSVMDTMGCVAKWKEKIEVKAKHELNGIPHVDVCDPSSANKVELFGADKSATYTLYVGHRTRCKYYPYCSVDDENGGLHIIDGKKHHIHEYVSENGEPEYENCVEHRAGIKAGDIEYKVKENNRWVSKSGYGISDIPSGTIGVLATMPDGCTAFDEYTFQSSGLPTSIMPVGTDSVSCNGVEDGAVSFSLYGGHGSYTKIALDGENLEIKHPKIEMITVSQKDTHAPYETNSKTINVKGGLLNNGQLFDQLKKYYDGEALYAEAVQLLKNSGSDTTYDMVSAIVSDLREFYGLTTYSFKIDELSATVNWEDNDSHRNKKHVITVTDEQDCETSMEFDIYQPTKLKLSVSASVICPDGSGRIFAANTSGGVPPYLYRLDKTTIDDVNAVFPKSGSKPKTYEGIELGNADAYGQYYAREYHKGDHIPAGKGVEHFMYVMDDNGCIMKSSNHTKLSDSWSWDSIEQDQLISTWHNYGDVLVVIDQTDYDSLTDEKGMIVNAVYDSMKVIIVMDKDAEDFEGIIQPKEMFAYGVRECSFAMEGEGEDIIEKCDTVVTPFDTCYSPSWGITPKMLEKYNEYIAEGHSLKPIHEYYQQLIPDSALLRMTFVKFQTKSGRDVNLSELIGNKDDYHLNFMIRVVAYVGGCDVVTEHNPLVLNLQGDDPFPGVNYKDLITVNAFPNPVARDGKCTLNVTLSNDRNEFSYTVFSLTGEVLGKGTIWQNHPHKEEKDEYGNSEYIYEFDITNIKETCIVKVTTETNTAAVKILAR